MLLVNSSLPQNRYRNCLKETELKKLPENPTHIFKKNILDRRRKFAVLDDMPYAKCLHYYHLKDHSTSNDIQPRVLNEEVIESRLSLSFL